MLLERQSGALYPLEWPLDGQGGKLALLDGKDEALISIDAERLPVDPSTWPATKRGLKVVVPRHRPLDQSLYLRYADQVRVDLGTLRHRLAQQLQSQMAVAIAAPHLPETLATLLSNLRGVILSAPHGGPHGGADGYCFNLREVVLAAGLVADPAQVFFVEEAIAPLLASWRSHNPASHASRPLAVGKGPTGQTLVMHTHAAATALLLADLTPGAEPLDYTDLSLPSFAYGETAIAQDILAQMLYAALDHADVKGANLDLPLPGQPDTVVRDRFQQRLQSTPYGQSLWHTAVQLQDAFSQQAAVEFQINDTVRQVPQMDFHRAVLWPYLRQFNRVMNAALERQGVAAATVQTVICSGTLANTGAIAHWLQRKFPQAQVLPYQQSTATGLACLPLYPQMLNATRHQYSDLFLLKEILASLPATPQPLGRILQILDQRGINTGVCQQAIVRLLEGHWPAGLRPTPEDAALMGGGEIAWATVGADPPLFQVVGQCYGLNRDVSDRLQTELADLFSQSRQTLTDPLPWTDLMDA